MGGKGINRVEETKIQNKRLGLKINTEIVFSKDSGQCHSSLSSSINTKQTAAKVAKLYLLQVYHILETEAGQVSCETHVPENAELGRNYQYCKQPVKEGSISPIHLG